MSFPRLGQMVVDYDPPMKRIAEEFIPHSKVESLRNLSRDVVPTIVCRVLVPDTSFVVAATRLPEACAHR